MNIEMEVVARFGKSGIEQSSTELPIRFTEEAAA